MRTNINIAICVIQIVLAIFMGVKGGKFSPFAYGIAWGFALLMILT